MEPQKSLYVLFVEDELILLESYVAAAEKYPEISKVARAINSKEVMTILGKEGKPDIAVVDLHLRDSEMNGFELIDYLRKEISDIKIIIQTRYDEDAYLMEGFAKAPNGFVSKYESIKEMFEAILEVAQGKNHISSILIERLADCLKKTGVVQDKVNDVSEKPLTKREQQITDLLIYSNVEISKRLSISQNTVIKHLRNIFKKLKVNNRRDAMLKNQIINSYRQ
jgi:DNA-binding NarL/FixJ family response regulator